MRVQIAILEWIKIAILAMIPVGAVWCLVEYRRHYPPGSAARQRAENRLVALASLVLVAASLWIRSDLRVMLMLVAVLLVVLNGLL
jgi:hypothetical protein